MSHNIPHAHAAAHVARNLLLVKLHPFPLFCWHAHPLKWTAEARSSWQANWQGLHL